MILQRSQRGRGDLFFLLRLTFRYDGSFGGPQALLGALGFGEQRGGLSSDGHRLVLLDRKRLDSLRQRFEVRLQGGCRCGEQDVMLLQLFAGLANADELALSPDLIGELTDRGTPVGRGRAQLRFTRCRQAVGQLRSSL